MKGHISILGFVGHAFSVTTTQLCSFNTKAAWTIYKPKGVVIFPYTF